MLPPTLVSLIPVSKETEPPVALDEWPPLATILPPRLLFDFPAEKMTSPELSNEAPLVTDTVPDDDVLALPDEM